MRLEIRHLGNGLPAQKSMRVSSYDAKISKEFNPSASSSCVLCILERGLVGNIAEFRVQLCPKMGLLSIISRINETMKGLLFNHISLSRDSTQIHTYIHTYIRTYMHTYIHAYVRTYILYLPTYHLEAKSSFKRERER